MYKRRRRRGRRGRRRSIPNDRRLRREKKKKKLKGLPAVFSFSSSILNFFTTFKRRVKRSLGIPITHSNGSAHTHTHNRHLRQKGSKTRQHTERDFLGRNKKKKKKKGADAMLSATTTHKPRPLFLIPPGFFSSSSSPPLLKKNLLSVPSIRRASGHGYENGCYYYCSYRREIS